MTTQEELAALRKANDELRADIAALHSAHEQLSDQHDALAERNRIESTALEEALAAAVRAARVLLDGFAENFESEFTAQARKTALVENWNPRYLDEIERLADLLHCSSEIRPRKPGA